MADYFDTAEERFYANNEGVKRMAKVLKVIKHQTGRTNVPVDKLVKAMPSGKRLSKNGKVYWETRKNRTDISPKKKI